MKELTTLEAQLRGLRQELKAIAKRKKSLNHLMSLKGYSLKTIKGNTYLYVWKTTGHGRAKWKCLGNINKLGGVLAVEELREAKLMPLIEEYESLEEREREIKELVEALLLAFEEAKTLKEVA